MGFSLHGKFCIQKQARIMRIDARGPWNLECTTEYARELGRELEAMTPPFAILAVSFDQALLSQEAEEILRLNVRARVERGCVAQATVLGDLRETVVARARYRRIYLTEGLLSEIFTTTPPAIQWLVNCGFPEAANLEPGMEHAPHPNPYRAARK
jgi:hypothetical protein